VHTLQTCSFVFPVAVDDFEARAAAADDVEDDDVLDGEG